MKKTGYFKCVKIKILPDFFLSTRLANTCGKFGTSRKFDDSVRLIGCWPNKQTQVRNPRGTGFERQTWKRRGESESGRRKLISRRQVNSFIRKRFVQTRLRANTSTRISFPSKHVYIYIYLNTADAFNRVDISSFGFHGNRKGGPKTRLVFVEKKHRLLERSILDN